MFVRLLTALLVFANLVYIGIYFNDIEQIIGFRATTPIVEPPQNLNIFIPPESTVSPSVQVSTNRISSPNCWVVGDFSTKEAAEAMRLWLQTRGISGRLDTRVIIAQQTHRVYGGTFPDQEAALFAQKVIERKDPKIKAFIQQVDNAWRVSFGQFVDIKQAEVQRQRIENMIEGFKVSIDSRTKSQTTNSVRYFDIQADKLQKLRDSQDKELLRRVETDGVAFTDCD